MLTRDEYRRAARDQVGADDEVEVDPDAKVNINTSEGYAWVQAWVFVRDPDWEEIQDEVDLAGIDHGGRAVHLAELQREIGPIAMTEDVHVRFGGKISLWRRFVRRFGLRSW